MNVSFLLLSELPSKRGAICRGAEGRRRTVGDGHSGVPFPESGTPGKLKGTQALPASPKEETPQWAQPCRWESPCVSPRLPAQGAPLRSPSAARLPACPGSAWGGAAPGTCSAAAQGRAWETRRPLRDARARDSAPRTSGSRESVSPWVAPGGWTQPCSGREHPSGRRQRTPSRTHAPLGLSAPGGRAPAGGVGGSVEPPAAARTLLHLESGKGGIQEPQLSQKMRLG